MTQRKARFAAHGLDSALLAALLSLLVTGCALVSRPTTDGSVAAPAMVRAADWGSRPQPLPDRLRHTPRFLTVHHAGVAWKPGTDPAQALRSLQAFGHNLRDWPDVPYHFLIAPDGRIYEGRALAYAPQSNTDYDVAGHIGIQLWGNFDVQRVSQAQLTSLAHLVAWLGQRHGIAVDTLRAHRDLTVTACPGQDLYRYVHEGLVQRWAQAIQRGELPRIDVLPALPQGPTQAIDPGP